MAGAPTGGWWNLFPNGGSQDSVDPSASTDATPGAPSTSWLTQSEGAVSKTGGPIGQVLAGAMDILGGIQQQQQHDSQATRFQQQAKLDLYDAGREVQAQDQRGQAMVSGAGAAAGAGNVTAGGSVAQAMRQTINRVNEADVASRYAGKVKNIEDLYEAQQERYAGKQAMLGGIMSGTMSFINAGTSLAGAPGAGGVAS